MSIQKQGVESVPLSPTAPKKRRWITYFSLCLFGLLGVVVVAGVFIWYQSQHSPDIAAYRRVSANWAQTEQKYRELIADSPQDRDVLVRRYQDEVSRQSETILQLAGKHEGTSGQLSLLLFLFTYSQDMDVRARAENQLIDQINASDIEDIADAVNRVIGAQDTAGSIVDTILSRIHSDPDHPSAAELLARTSTLIQDARSPQFKGIADMIVERYADSEDIANFCEMLGRAGGGSISGAENYLTHLNTIFENNPHRGVRCAALFSIAHANQNSPSPVEQKKALGLYRQFLSEFDGEQQYRYAGVERTLRTEARQAIEAIELRGVGQIAIEIDGFDLNGNDLRLSQFRGKVVLLSFWASWCHPCLKMVPHEIELANEFKDQPFALVGVNGDRDPELGIKAAQQHGIFWPSFQSKDRAGVPISTSWEVDGWPTIVLIDADGVIRKTWTGDQGPDQIRKEVQAVVQAVVDSMND